MALIKKPKFLRQEGKRFKRLKNCWRKPKGVHSKLRLRRRGKPTMVSIGYKAPEKVRGLVKGNIQQVSVSKPEHLKFIKKGEVAVLKKTSNRKRLEILLEAKKLNIQVFNFPNLDKKIVQIKESLSSKKIAKKIKLDKKSQKEVEEKKKSKMSQKQAAKEESKKETTSESKPKLEEKVEKKIEETKPEVKEEKKEVPKAAEKKPEVKEEKKEAKSESKEETAEPAKEEKPKPAEKKVEEKPEPAKGDKK
jgi:large subunit ribosomal protein L32e